MKKTSWIKLSTTYYLDGDIAAAGEAAEVLYVRALAHVAEQGTDGIVHRESLPYLVARGGPARAAALVAAGAWEPVPEGWRIVGWRRRTFLVRAVIPLATRLAVYQRDGWRCVRCSARWPLTLDHIWPWSRGGSDDIDNLQTLCRSCNSSKGARVDG